MNITLLNLEALDICLTKKINTAYETGNCYYSDTNEPCAMKPHLQTKNNI